MKHEWVKYGKYVACKKCGFVQNEENKNRDCKHGHVNITTRGKTND